LTGFLGNSVRLAIGYHLRDRSYPTMKTQRTAHPEARIRQEILAAVDRAEASYANGEGNAVRTLPELAQLAERIKRRGLERWASHEATR
jgi:hypothetical protein